MEEKEISKIQRSRLIVENLSLINEEIKKRIPRIPFAYTGSLSLFSFGVYSGFHKRQIKDIDLVVHKEHWHKVVMFLDLDSSKTGSWNDIYKFTLFLNLGGNMGEPVRLDVDVIEGGKEEEAIYLGKGSPFTIGGVEVTMEDEIKILHPREALKAKIRYLTQRLESFKTTRPSSDRNFLASTLKHFRDLYYFREFEYNEYDEEYEDLREKKPGVFTKDDLEGIF